VDGAFDDLSAAFGAEEGPLAGRAGDVEAAEFLVGKEVDELVDGLEVDFSIRVERGEHGGPDAGELSGHRSS